MSFKQIEQMDKYNEFIQWGRKHPIQFCKLVLGIDLLDYQAYIISNTWVARVAVWVCSRNAGKSFIGAVYVMLRALLFPKLTICFLAPSAKQANDTFTKMEMIAKKNIESLLSLTDIFSNELVKNKADSDGFTHGAKGYTCELYNGSRIVTIVGTEKTAVGVRSNLNFYDEAGKVGREFFAHTEPFCAQNKNFKTGGNYDSEIYPQDVANQMIYASSAEDIDTHLWDVYKDCAIKMMMGDRDYFCADVNCEMPLHPKLYGKNVNPLLTQEQIDTDMKLNSAKATREYYNIFDRTGGTNSMIKRYAITRNEQEYIPVYESEKDTNSYVICFDPAATTDNSIVLVGKIYFDDKLNLWKGRLSNIFNLIEERADGSRGPMRKNEQLESLRKIILSFNGKNKEYDNIDFLVDIGAGGGGRQYAEDLWSNWRDRFGREHRGLIDLEDELSRQNEVKYPMAVDKCHMIEPKKMRQKLFESLVNVVEGDLIEFPVSLPKDRTFDVDGYQRELTKEEIKSFVEIDLMKEEITHFVKTKNPKDGSINYSLPPDLIRKMHDDRCYCFAMFCWWIDQLNRSDIYDNGKSSLDFSKVYGCYKGQSNNGGIVGGSAAFGGNRNRQALPFAGLKNPFGRRR